VTACDSHSYTRRRRRELDRMSAQTIQEGGNCWPAPGAHRRRRRRQRHLRTPGTDRCEASSKTAASDPSPLEQSGLAGRVRPSAVPSTCGHLWTIRGEMANRDASGGHRMAFLSDRMVVGCWWLGAGSFVRTHPESTGISMVVPLSVTRCNFWMLYPHGSFRG
jgi:hypothetical protein